MASTNSQYMSEEFAGYRRAPAGTAEDGSCAAEGQRAAEEMDDAAEERPARRPCKGGQQPCASRSRWMRAGCVAAGALVLAIFAVLTLPMLVGMNEPSPGSLQGNLAQPQQPGVQVRAARDQGPPAPRARETRREAQPVSAQWAVPTAIRDAGATPSAVAAMPDARDAGTGRQVPGHGRLAHGQAGPPSHRAQFGAHAPMAAETAGDDAPAGTDQRAATDADDAADGIARIEAECRALRTMLEAAVRRLDAVHAGADSQKAASPAASATADGDPGMADAMKAMTDDIQRLTRENADLREQLAERQRLLDEARTQAAAAAKAAAAKDVPAAKAKGAPDARPAAEAKAPAGIGGWRVLGLTSDRAVIEIAGRTRTVAAGDAVGAVRITAVDVRAGTVKTSAGTLRYGE